MANRTLDRALGKATIRRERTAGTATLSNSILENTLNECQEILWRIGLRFVGDSGKDSAGG